MATNLQLALLRRDKYDKSQTQNILISAFAKPSYTTTLTARLVDYHLRII